MVDVGDIDFDFDFDATSITTTPIEINDDGTITIIMDDAAGATWPLPQGGGSYQPVGGNQGSTTGPSFSPSGTIKVNTTVNNTTSPKVNLAGGSGTVKTNVSYVIVCNDGSTLELSEQNPITPKEMIGITKFINSVSSYYVAIFAHGARSTINMSWSKLIDNLGIRRHFKAGPPKAAYDTTGDTVFVFLNDV